MQSLGFYNLLIFFLYFFLYIFYVIITFEFLFILSIAYLHKLLRIYIILIKYLPKKKNIDMRRKYVFHLWINSSTYNRCDFWAISIHTMVYYTRNKIMLYLGVDFHWLNIQNDIWRHLLNSLVGILLKKQSTSCIYSYSVFIVV